jgi:hypothetical protein
VTQLQRGAAEEISVSLFPADRERLERFVAAGCPAQTESVLADAHIFWWDTCGAEDADFAIINRNGNFARVIQKGGIWEVYKNLGRAGQCFTPEHWEKLSLRGPCLREIAQKMWLPDRDEERLTFLPKELTPPRKRRMLICRNQLFTLNGLGDTEGFKLIGPGGVDSPTFQGKPWESVPAIDWAVARCTSVDAPKSAEAVLQAAQFQQAAMAAEDALEGIWGQF